jgi:hypothetical protein
MFVLIQSCHRYCIALPTIIRGAGKIVYWYLCVSIVSRGYDHEREAVESKLVVTNPHRWIAFRR